jgi:hypothetical protein
VAEPGRRRSVGRKLLIVLAVCAVAGALGECVARSHVPKNGVTPFRIGSFEQLKSELRPGFETLYRGHAVRINSSGFRGPEFPAPVPGALRIALVGDSFTFGNGVDWEDTLGERLQSHVEALGRPAQVLNCGVPGYNAEHVALVARERVLPLQPDLLVYVFFANDMEASEERVEVPPDAVIDPYYGFRLRSACVQWLVVYAKRALVGLGLDVERRVYLSKRSQWEQGGRARLETALESLKSDCAARGVRFEVAIYPFLVPREFNPFREVDALASEACARLGIPCTYLLKAIPEGASPYAYWSSVYDSHPNAAANELAGSFLARELLSRP